jgi:endonuclease-8
MPEGDTIHGAADRLGAALVGKAVTNTGGSHRSMIEFGRRVVGTQVVDVNAHGKHLLIHFSNGWTLRTHLQMTGSWRTYRPGEHWNITPGKARAVLETADVVAVCFAAPTVQLAPWHVVSQRLDYLGPDLMGDFDAAEIAARLYEMAGDAAIAEAIVDQRIVAGIGNVYKSELLFLERVHPYTPASSVELPVVAAVLRRAHDLLLANRGRHRTTTGRRGPGQQSWVYGRAGQPCRRCGTVIQTGQQGRLQRSTYWCPSCQPVQPAGT